MSDGLSQSSVYTIFQDSRGFIMYSQNDGGIFDDTLEIPEKQYFYDKDQKLKIITLKKDFFNDDKRFLYLKGLHRCLSEWTVDYDRFTKDIIDTDKIVMNGKLWIK